MKSKMYAKAALLIGIGAGLVFLVKYFRDMNKPATTTSTTVAVDKQTTAVNGLIGKVIL
jgi:hypothetical protein